MALREYVKAVVHGTLHGSQTWSFGLNFVSVDSISPLTSDLNTFAQAVYADFLAQVWNVASTGYKANMGVNDAVVGVNTYYYPAGSSRAETAGASSGAAAAGTATANAPDQVALCVTLLTPNVGSHYRGRVYLPVKFTSVDNANHLTVPSAGSVSVQMSNFLAAAQGHSIGTAAVSVGVLSRTLGVITPITSVRCDNVADTIRARRDKTVATIRVTTPLPVG